MTRRNIILVITLVSHCVYVQGLAPFISLIACQIMCTCMHSMEKERPDTIKTIVLIGNNKTDRIIIIGIHVCSIDIVICTVFTAIRINVG